MDILMLELIDNLMDAEELNDVVPRRQRTPRDAFSLSENSFIKLFRLNKQMTRSVIRKVRPLLQEQNRPSDLNLEAKVLVTLNFLGHGSYQTISGKNSYIDMSQSSVSRSITEVVTALNNPQIIREFIKFPRNMDELRAAKHRFQNKYNSLTPIGIIDCTHVAIIAPKENEQVYVNRKNYHSINVQLICDENLRILNVEARYPGSFHDSRIWSLSSVANIMEQVFRRNPNEIFYLMGDSGYPLRPWLMTPILNPIQNTPEERFNNNFKLIRSLIERCNGLLKSRFRCLLQHRTLHYAPEKAVKIIVACCILHNICIDNNILIPDDEDVVVENQNEFIINDAFPIGNVNPDLAVARHMRQEIINNLFV